MEWSPWVPFPPRGQSLPTSTAVTSTNPPLKWANTPPLPALLTPTPSPWDLSFGLSAHTVFWEL